MQETNKQSPLEKDYSSYIQSSLPFSPPLYLIYLYYIVHKKVLPVICECYICDVRGEVCHRFVLCLLLMCLHDSHACMMLI